MLDKWIRDFFVLWATIDPVGTLAIFIGLTASMPRADRRAVACRSVLYAGIVLVGFIVLGQLLLQLLEISMVAFRLSGGIILFLFGLQMIFGHEPADDQAKTERGHDIAVFPLAIPSIASPGAMTAAVLLTDNGHFDLMTQVGTACVLLLVLSVTWLLMFLSRPIYRVLGEHGCAILIRVMGVILAALATEHILNGLHELAQVYFKQG